MWAKYLTPAAIGLLLGAAAFVAFSGGASDAAGIRARVIDGDTIENVETGERIRLQNIDTPETGHRADCQAERAAGERATNEARRLIGGATVTVHPTGRQDQYGRTVAHVRVNDRDLGRLMIEAGLARPWRGRQESWCAADGSLLR